jgi:hypothetical protein
MQAVVRNDDEGSRKELATKEDLQNVTFDILKWMIGILIGQTALIVALMAYMQ